MGFLNGLAGAVGDVVGTAFGIAVAPLSLALGVSETVVKRAIAAGCETEAEIRRWIAKNC